MNHISNNQGLFNKLNELNNRLDSLTTNRRPYIADWQEVLTRISATVSQDDQFLNNYARLDFIDFGIDLRNFFALGDKVRGKTGGSFKYFYIIGIEQDSIYLFGGNAQSFVDGEVTEFAFSRTTGRGHSKILTWIPHAYALDPMIGEAIPPNVAGNFSMLGNTVYIDGFINSIILTGTPSLSILIDLPIDPVEGFNRYMPVMAGTEAMIFFGIESAEATGIPVYQNINPHNSTLVISKVDLTNWVTSVEETFTAIASFTFNVQYEI